MTEANSQHLIISIAWLLYFVIHSLTASTRLKQVCHNRLRLNTQRYRLLYVIVSFVLLLPIAHLVWQDTTPTLWQHSGITKIVLDGLALIAIIGFVVVARSYNMLSFLGFSEDKGNYGFRVSWLHRYVRHPWYFFGLIIIWSRDMSTLWLLSCICITVYLIIGSRLEENKLLAEFGKVYRYYQQKVPGLIVIPGRYLDDEALQELNTLKH